MSISKTINWNFNILYLTNQRAHNCYDVRTLKFFPPAECWLVNSNFRHASRMQGCTHDFSRALSELQVIARSCDWFIALSAPVVISRRNCFGFGFSTVIWKPLYPKPCYIVRNDALKWVLPATSIAKLQLTAVEPLRAWTCSRLKCTNSVWWW